MDTVPVLVGIVLLVLVFVSYRTLLVLLTYGTGIVSYKYASTSNIHTRYMGTFVLVVYRTGGAIALLSLWVRWVY